MDALLLIALPLAAFYFLIIRPTQTRRRKQQQVVQSLSIGDRVMTHSGQIGVVADVADDVVHIQIAPGVVTEWASWGIGGVVPDPTEIDSANPAAGDTEWPNEGSGDDDRRA